MQPGSAKAKIAIIGAIVLVMLMSLISGQNPFDVFVNLIKDTFVFVFLALIFIAPIALIAYIFVICFTGFEGGMNISMSEITKQKMVSMIQTIMPSNPKNDNKGPSVKTKKKKVRKSGTEQ